MPEKVASMDAIREQYIKDVDGGQMAEVYPALYDLMDEFSRRAHETYQRDLAALQAKNPADFDAQKAVLLKSLNETLKRNAMNKIRLSYSKSLTYGKRRVSAIRLARLSMRPGWMWFQINRIESSSVCLLYTSDAADED